MAMNNQKTAATMLKEQKVADFKGMINTSAMVKRMTTALGGDKAKAGQFMASMLDLYEGDTSLQECDPNKVVAECIKAASLNLPLLKSLGYAYVVPYAKTPTFIVGWRGLVQLALRSGQYRYLNADAIYEGEEITVDRMSGMMKVGGNKVSDTPIGYFAYFQLVNGFEKSLYMSVEDLKAYGKKFSKAYSNGPWQTNFEAMCKKTLLRQILKYGPASAEMQEAERYEVEQAEAEAQMEVRQNANQGAIIDVQVAEQAPIAVDNATGEVLPGFVECMGEDTPDF